MTVIKKRQNGTIEIVEDALIEVSAGDSVFSEATQAAAVEVVPAWEAPKSYKATDVFSHSGKLWRVLNDHTSQLDWLPGIAHSLYVETWSSGTIPTWKQPLGGHDAYPAGFEVYHETTDRIWVSNIDANVWEPNSVADTWTLRDDQEPIVPDTEEWQPDKFYAGTNTNPENPAIVTHGGLTYRCRQSHTSQTGWEPPVVPALWELV